MFSHFPSAGSRACPAGEWSLAPVCDVASSVPDTEELVKEYQFAWWVRSSIPSPTSLLMWGITVTESSQRSWILAVLVGSAVLVVAGEAALGLTSVFPGTR